MKRCICLLLMSAALIFAGAKHGSAFPSLSLIFVAVDMEGLTEAGDKKGDREPFEAEEQGSEAKPKRKGAGFWGGPYWGYGPRWGHPCQSCRSDCESDDDSARCKRCRVRCGL
jgi:hypothetical protein